MADVMIQMVAGALIFAGGCIFGAAMALSGKESNG